MDLHQTSLIDGLAEDHLVRQWWEGRLGNGSEGVTCSWPCRPNGAKLDEMKDGAGENRLDRSLLVEIIKNQYAESGLPTPSRLSDLSQDSARTVTTGHQLCLAMGPAFTVYKILSAVHFAAALQKRWGTPVIPVFWLASEDHDFEEVSALWDGEAWHQWSSDVAGRAVGRIDVSGAFKVLSVWGERAGLQEGAISGILKAVHGTLSSAMRRWVHSAIGSDRIVVIDGDDARFKAAFAPKMSREIQEGILCREVSKVNSILQSRGHVPQVHVREINLFYLQQHSRDRLVKNGESWSAGSLSWTDTGELLDHLARDPQSFSPNALFRPLYQAFLLPDIAVVGGLAEVAYWIQLSRAYPALSIQAPALVPRDSVRITPAPWHNMALEMSLSHLDFGAPLHSWESQWLARFAIPGIQMWREAMDREAEEAIKKLSAIDATLTASVEATKAKMMKLLNKLEGQGRRAIRRQHADELEGLALLHQWLNPLGNAQERVVNFHALSAAWTGEEGLNVLLERAFIKGHQGENWSPVIHDLMDNST